MQSASLKVWTDLLLPQALLHRLCQGLDGAELIVAQAPQSSVLVTASVDPRCRRADIAFGQPAVQDLVESTSLQWIHLSTAGYTRYDNDPLRHALKARGAILTNSSLVYQEPTAEHLLAMILALSRQLPQAWACKKQRQWNSAALRQDSPLLPGQTLLIVGHGHIGRRLAELLSPLGMNLIGFRRDPRGDESIPTWKLSCLDEHLPSADHVVNILPASASTHQFFDAARFGRFKPSAKFYNIGRGTTVDQEALLHALQNGRIDQAYLDVTEPEPLPPDHPLWTCTRCHITPHTGGGFSREFEAHVDFFLEQFRAWRSGRPLRGRIV